jgi:hypothetical protein
MSILSTGNSKPIVWLTRKQQRQRWRNISARTLKRWGADPAMNLPPEIDLNGRPCCREDQIEEWERSRIITEANRRARASAIERIPSRRPSPAAKAKRGEARRTASEAPRRARVPAE